MGRSKRISEPGLEKGYLPIIKGNYSDAAITSLVQIKNLMFGNTRDPMIRSQEKKNPIAGYKRAMA